LMAKAFPKSRFFGFDYHDKSIEAARESAKRNGVGDRVTFEVAKAKEFPGKDYDFVAVFDCLHDMGDPVGAARHVAETLKPDGTWMVVEPFAHEGLIGMAFVSGLASVIPSGGSKVVFGTNPIAFATPVAMLVQIGDHLSGQFDVKG